VLHHESGLAAQNALPADLPTHHMTARKQLSMVLPTELIKAIKQRASEQALSITAYITMLVMQDLKIPLHSAAEHGPVRQRLEALERRVSDLEEKGV
jgi:hypothetical protein